MEIVMEKLLSSIISKSLSKEIKKISKEGYSVYELEADVTIPAEYILMMHFIGEIDIEVQNKIKKYILNLQNKEGGWPLFYDGESNISATVKAYYALKLSGIKENDRLMLRAKKVILKNGGAEKSNVFTKISLAMFGQISWNAIPVMPIEILNLPKWFPFNLGKVSYWSRTVIVPLLIILFEKPLANNPNGTSIKELFKDNSNSKIILNNRNFLSILFLIIDKILRKIQILFPKDNKRKCLELAYSWIKVRSNSEDGLGAIFPAMVNAYIALSLDRENRFVKETKLARTAIDKLLVIKKDEAYCQPCVSPVWDTGWVAYGMLENKKDIKKSIDWLLKKEIKTKGDWSSNRPNLAPGGWAFQYNNSYYPDVDDSALIGMVLDRYNRKNPSKEISESIERTRKWILGMQSKNGGWGSFDADNTYYYLNHIPFADHGALLDPPTVDVTARCLSFLAQIDNKSDKEKIIKATNYIVSEQEKNGSWFGRWGTNYIYGTWSALSALNLVEFKEKRNVIDSAINYLKKKQREDGGWGEDGSTYVKKFKDKVKESTPSQTSWAILGLLSVGEIKSSEVERGIKYLVKNFSENSSWEEKPYTAVGFPKVFYLKYHGYSKYFPILAISKYQNLLKSNLQKNIYGV